MLKSATEVIIKYVRPYPFKSKEHGKHFSALIIYPGGHNGSGCHI